MAQTPPSLPKKMLSNASPHHSPYHHQQQQSHSPNIKRGMVPIKQGFVYKRGGSGLLAHWKLKYLILSSSSNNPNLVTLQIYDKRDQSEPPKHEIKLQDAAVEVVLPQLGGASGALASRLEILRGGSSSKYTFSISNRSRKVKKNRENQRERELGGFG